MSFGKFKDAINSDKNKLKVQEGSAVPVIEKLSDSERSVRESKAVLGPGSKIVGELSLQGPAELGGEVEGEICAVGRLVIAESAEIKASISAGEVIIFGSVVGDISAETALVLRSPARVTGNLSCPVLTIEEGVYFKGACEMSRTEAPADDAAAAGNGVKAAGRMKTV